MPQPKIAEEDRTIVIYESPHKLKKTLDQLSAYCSPERKVSISRELTKLYEETFRGNLAKAIEHFELKAPRGEFVVCIEGKSTK